MFRTLRSLALLAFAIASSCVSFTNSALAQSSTPNSSAVAEVSQDDWIVVDIQFPSGPKSQAGLEIYSIRRNQLASGGGYLCGIGARRCTDDVWVKGDHKLNPNVPYRSSLTRYAIGCPNLYGKDEFITYDAAGKILSHTEKVDRLHAIVPDSPQERIARKFCRFPR